MPVARLIILLLLLLGVALLTLQNWSPALPLVFWGMETQPLPLGVWVAIAIATGALTNFFITGLLQLANAFSPNIQSPRTAAEHPTADRTVVQSATRTKIQTPDYETASTGQFSQTVPQEAANFSSAGSQTAANAAAANFDADNPNPWQPAANQFQVDDRKFDDRKQEIESTPDESDWSDWEEEFEPAVEDTDWPDWEEEPEPADRSPSRRPVDRTSQNYEKPQTPRTTSRSGSTYSYSYRDSSKSGAGSRESVYDAEYRVIIPPYRPLDSEGEDFEEEDFEEEDF